MEGIPLAVVEAMAASRPVVATEVGGVSELITPEVSGLLVPAGSAPALAQALFHLRAEPELAARLGAAGRSVVEQHYNVEDTSGQLADLYRETLTN